MQKALRALWILVCLIVLVSTLARFDGRPNSDVEEFLIYGMIALTFPSGLVATAVLAVVSVLTTRLTGDAIPCSYAYLCAVWSGYLAAGYTQWFILLPRLLDRMRGPSIR